MGREGAGLGRGEMGWAGTGSGGTGPCDSLQQFRNKTLVVIGGIVDERDLASGEVVCSE